MTKLDQGRVFPFAVLANLSIRLLDQIMAL